MILCALTELNDCDLQYKLYNIIQLTILLLTLKHILALFANSFQYVILNKAATADSLIPHPMKRTSLSAGS